MAKANNIKQKQAEVKQEEEVAVLDLEKAKQIEEIEKQKEEKQNEVKSIKFRKLTNAPFGFKGRIIKEKVFELSKEEAEDKRIKTAIRAKLIEVVEG
jgi:hypothetical protein